MHRMTSPYQPSQQFEPPPSTSATASGLSVPGIISWALGLFLLTVMASSVITALGFASLGLTAQDVTQPMGLFRLTQLIACGVLELLVFAWVGTRANSRPARDVSGVLVAYLMLGTSISALFLDVSLLQDAIEGWLPALASAALGYAIARRLT